MDEAGCLGGLIGIGIVIYLIYLFVVYVVIPILAIALSVIVIVLAIALVVGAIYGLIISAYNYIEAINQVFGERANYERMQSED